MANLSKQKTEMTVQDPLLRAKNFDEVALGYDESQAKTEAERCLNCKNKPCVSGCPVNRDIPEFIQKVKDGDFLGAYKVLEKSGPLAAVCGRVCPQETQCECKCVRGRNGEPVAIGRLERFAADYFSAHKSEDKSKIVSNGHKVAVVGSGPAGLSCAGELCSRGYEVTVFEALHLAGGVLVYGIPEFRLPKKIVESEIDNLKSLGVKFELNTVIGKTVFVDELFDDGYEAVFIGSGAGLPNFMKIKGEELNGVYSANEFLTRVNLMKAYLDGADTPIKRSKSVVVVGGGNVAMDAARSALRLGAERVMLVYRRSEQELPARKEEVEHAKEEGVEFIMLTAPLEALGDEQKNVRALKCQKMELGEPDGSGRRRPVPIPNSEFELETDTVIVAVGTSPNPLIKNTTTGIDVNRWGGIITDESGKTTRDMVYAGGDAVTGAATVILAMGAGKSAAQQIDSAIKAKKK
ncbi:MAG: NADPH-dependent glutamate synthase [Clostridiales bacterium]|nr:NADPH-dependent glutamate synthase [Clostridiales bacterium]